MTRVNLNKALPYNVTLDENRLMTTEPIKKNELICTIKSRLLPIDKDISIILDGKTIDLSSNKHFVVLNDNIKELIGISCLMSHSCSPNTRLIKKDKNEYNLESLIYIGANEELTYDYATLRFLFTSSFKCECFSPHCRKTIKF